MAVSALTINRDHPEDLDKDAQEWIKERKEYYKDDSAAFLKSINQGYYLTFADKDGNLLKFNQEGLIDNNGKVITGSIPKFKDNGSGFFIPSNPMYHIPDEAVAAQQDKIKKFVKLRDYLTAVESKVPLLFNGIHTGSGHYRENITPVTPSDEVTLRKTEDGKLALYKKDGSNFLPLKGPRLGLKRELLETVMEALTHPEKLRGESLDGDGVDKTGHYNALLYISQFVNVNNAENLTTGEKPIANSGHVLIGLEKSKGNLTLNVFDDKGNVQEYKDLTNLTPEQRAKVQSAFEDQRLLFNFKAVNKGYVTTYSKIGDNMVPSTVRYMEFLSKWGFGVPEKMEDRDYNPSIMVDVEKVPEIPQTKDAVPQKETKKVVTKTPVIYQDMVVSGAPVDDFDFANFDESANFDTADMPPEMSQDELYGMINTDINTIDSGASVDDFDFNSIEKGSKSALKAAKTIDELTNIDPHESPKVTSKPNVEGPVEDPYKFGEEDFGFPFGDTEDFNFDETCK